MNSKLTKLTTARDAWLLVGMTVWQTCNLESLINTAIVESKTFCDYVPDDQRQMKILKSFARKHLGYCVTQKMRSGKIVLVFDWSMF